MPSSTNIGDIISKATKAVRDGYSASMASIVSVFLLMWIRTTLSYQFVHDVSMFQAMRLLYDEGGIPRFYKVSYFIYQSVFGCWSFWSEKDKFHDNKLHFEYKETQHHKFEHPQKFNIHPTLSSLVR